MRLAPTCGLLLPDGRYLHGTSGLESLLAAHPEGLDLPPGSMPLVRRLQAMVRRRRLPLELVRSPPGRLAGGAGSGRPRRKTAT